MKIPALAGLVLGLCSCTSVPKALDQATLSSKLVGVWHAAFSPEALYAEIMQCTLRAGVEAACRPVERAQTTSTQVDDCVYREGGEFHCKSMLLCGELCVSPNSYAGQWRLDGRVLIRTYERRYSVTGADAGGQYSEVVIDRYHDRVVIVGVAATKIQTSVGPWYRNSWHRAEFPRQLRDAL